MPVDYLPIPSAQDESSWRTYINGRKGKGRASREGDTSVQSVPAVATASSAVVSTSHEDLLTNKTDNAPNDEAAAAIGTEGTAANTPARVVRTEPRPPIPILMRTLDHVSNAKWCDPDW